MVGSLHDAGVKKPGHDELYNKIFDLLMKERDNLPPRVYRRIVEQLVVSGLAVE